MTYHWDFSDGAGNLPENSQQNPSWRFWDNDETSFTVSLTVTNAYGTDTIVKQNYITLVDTSMETSSLSPNPATDKVSSYGRKGDTRVFGDWNGDGKTKIGVYKDGAWHLDYNGNGAFDTNDKAYAFGKTGWLPVTGDWNGDKKIEIGIYLNGNWYLDYNGNGAFDTKDKVYAFGKTGWTQIVGDWNGDGKTEIGVYKDGAWYLDYNGNGAFDTNDKVYAFGKTGWLPVTGDWNGDKKDEIGVYLNGNWYLDYNGNGVFNSNDKVYAFGKTGWTQIVGDWNGDGKTEIGVYKDAVWYLDYGGRGVIDASTKYYRFGTAGWTPLIGDWNGNKKDEIGVYQNGNWYLDYDGSGSWTTGTVTAPKSPVVSTTPPTEATGACYGAEACNPTGNPIGGGAGYTDIILQNDARVKYVVTTAAGLKSALASARSGEVVFVPSTATIDVTAETSSITIPAGVTLASDRGYKGSTGGLIKRNSASTIPKGTFIAGGNDVRVTGLRIQGPHSGYGASYGDNVKCAIMETNKKGLEVDNCEIYYWSYAGVAFENSASGSWTGHVHHNNIHHIAGEGYGYGVMVAYGDVLIEANKFDYTRHAVIGEGCPGEKFEYRYNHYGKNSLNPVLDCHRDCGGWSAGGVSGRLYLVHHNTIEYAGSVAYNLYGTPSEKVSIYNNIFPTRIQALNGWTRIYLTNNYFGGVLKASGQ